MRLIDADALFENLKNVSWFDNADRDDIALELVLDAPTITPSPNDPLTLDELWTLDGAPVWIERHDSHPITRWAIVGGFDSLYGVYFGTALGGLRLPYEDYGKTWFAYRRKPEEGTA